MLNPSLKDLNPPSEEFAIAKLLAKKEVLKVMKECLKVDY